MLASLVAVVALAAVHLASTWLRHLRFSPRSRLLSAAGGMAVAFVFVQLLPSVAHAQRAVADEGGAGWPPVGELLFLAMLLGLLAAFAVERSVRMGMATRPELRRRLLWLGVGSSALLEVTIGYLLVVEARAPLPLALFTLAMALRALITDRGLYETHRDDFDRSGRPVLLLAAPTGWLLGVGVDLPDYAIGAVRAVLAGGVVLHVLTEELPEDRESDYLAFVVGALAYAALLLVA